MTVTIQGYFGPKQSGKTTLAFHHANKQRRLLIFDINGQDALAKGALVVTTLPDLLAALIAKADGNRPFKICWRGVLSMGHDFFEAGNLAAFQAENLAVLWDEADLMIGNSPNLPQWARMLINAGAHRGVSVYFTSRRPARVPRDLTSNSDRICCFRTHEPRDLEYLKKQMGGYPEIGALPQLEDYHALDWQPGSVPVVKKSPFS